MTQEATDTPLVFEPSQEVIIQKPLTIENLYHNVLRKTPNDGCGKYQWFIFISIITGLSGFGYMEYGLGYYELFPVYNCYIDGVFTKGCTT